MVIEWTCKDTDANQQAGLYGAYLSWMICGRAEDPAHKSPGRLLRRSIADLRLFSLSNHFERIDQTE